ncbi:MAG TPA: trehalose-phosphatase [Terricaulis sp.]|nr:trehalose-phosphatase [Terricaulis sp.]HRP10797.1 trehalose-phosphatase [Terricaulis sp.]
MAGLKDTAPPALDAAHDALFLDLDGTLVEIADDPAQVRMDEAARAMLRALAKRAGGAVAVLTGRTMAEADRISGAAIGAVAALHGLEMRWSHAAPLQAPQPARQVRDLAAMFAKQIARGDLNARLEDKNVSLALHYRHAPEAEARVHEAACAAAAAHNLRTMKGKMVIEILPPGANKGDALRAFMQAPPFAGRRPIMVGDDITDESAFEAANALGGASILVGPARASAASSRLDGVAAVRAWLGAALEAAR